MRRFLTVFAVVAVAFCMVSGAMAAENFATIQYSNKVNLSAADPAALVAREAIPEDGLPINVQPQGIYFKLNGLPLLGNAGGCGTGALTFELNNALYGPVPAGYSYALVAVDPTTGLPVATNPLVAIGNAGGPNADYIVFSVVAPYTDVNGLTLSLCYYNVTNGAYNPIIRIVISDELRTSGGVVSISLTKVSDSWCRNIPVPAGALNLFQVTSEFALAPCTTSGSNCDTIDVARDREQFVPKGAAPFATTLLTSKAPAFTLRNPGTFVTDLNLRANLQDVRFEIETSTWDGVQFVNGVPAVDILYPNGNAVVGTKTFVDGHFILEVEAPFDDNITSTGCFHLSITVTGDEVLQTRTWAVTAYISFLTGFQNLEFDDVTVGCWDVNGYQAICPYMGTKTYNWGTGVVLNNSSDADADVSWDLIAIDAPAVTDLSEYTNMMIPGKEQVPEHGSLYIDSTEFVKLFGLDPTETSRFAVRVTVTAKPSDVTGMAWKRQGTHTPTISVPLLHSQDPDLGYFGN